MKTNGNNISELIELYAMGELQQDKIPLVEEHLRRNPDVQKEVEEIRRVYAVVSSCPLNEPSQRLVSDTKRALHSLMEHERQKPIIPFVRNVYRIITRPAFASAAALIAISVCLLLIFMPNKPEQTATPADGGKTISPYGIAITVDKDFNKYVTGSADFFAAIPSQNSVDFKNSLDVAKIFNEIAQGMRLLENEELAQDTNRRSLLTDIESVWRSIKDLAEGKSSVTFETIKDSITEKNIINRARDFEIEN